MARYDREFLVPYLQNVCAVHLAERKVVTEKSQLSQQLDYQKKLLSNGGVREPNCPSLYKVASAGKIVVLLLGLFCIGLVLFVLIMLTIDPSGAGSDEAIEAMRSVCTFIMLSGIITTIIPIYLMISQNQDNIKTSNQYETDLAIYNQKRTENITKAQENIAVLENKLQECNKEYQLLRDLSDKLYDANVIPRQYRNLYAAVYLYDWFSTSGADDLDHALSMFVLEEIKERLDTVIENQTEILLNQQIMIANQYRSLELQSQYHSQMLGKLDRIEASNEERNRYLGMIEGNTATIAYFTASEYFLK